MELKYPIEYELSPETVDQGTHSITIRLRNIGDEDLSYVKVDLNSRDSHGIVVYGTYKTIQEIKRNETEEISFEVDALRSTDVYFILTATKGKGSFYWESSPISLMVGKEKAKLEGLFVLTHPYLLPGTTAEVEAIIKSLENSERLRLEFWVETPKDVSEEVVRLETKELSAGEETQYSANITFKEKGIHTVHAYLYDKDKRIDYKSDTVLVK